MSDINSYLLDDLTNVQKMYETFFNTTVLELKTQEKLNLFIKEKMIELFLLFNFVERFLFEKLRNSKKIQLRLLWILWKKYLIFGYLLIVLLTSLVLGITYQIVKNEKENGKQYWSPGGTLREMNSTVVSGLSKIRTKRLK